MDSKSKHIQRLWYSHNRNDLIKLFSMLKFYGIPMKKVTYFIHKCVKENKNDFDIVTLFKNMSKRAVYIDDDRRGNSRGKDILSLLNESRQNIPTMYLDIGASDGLITKAIGNALGLSKSQIHAVDIEGWSGHENKANDDVKDDIHFSIIHKDAKTIIPYENMTFDFITVLQALHHFENLPEMMKEIQRLCSPNGIVIIREHNANNKGVYALTDLEHLLYGVMEDELPVEELERNYYGVYRSAENWDKIFKIYGFECVHKHQKRNPTRHYYAVYKNVGFPPL
jgi:ubiquinone/menaquinone biosynthesis C-methylase UbiE